MNKPSLAFTLIELLVAVSCLSLFVALFFTTHEYRLESANSAKCINNLRQVGIGFSIYANANDGDAPQLQAGWPGTNKPVTAYWPATLVKNETIPDVSLFDCPTLYQGEGGYLSLGPASDLDHPDWKTIEYGINAIHLATSMRPLSHKGDLDLSFAAMQTPAAMQEIVNPSEMIAFADSVNSKNLERNGNEAGFYSVFDSKLPGSSFGQARARHLANTVNVMWLDGHSSSVETLTSPNPYAPNALTDGLEQFNDNYWDRN